MLLLSHLPSFTVMGEISPESGVSSGQILQFLAPETG